MENKIYDLESKLENKTKAYEELKAKETMNNRKILDLESKNKQLNDQLKEMKQNIFNKVMNSISILEKHKQNDSTSKLTNFQTLPEKDFSSLSNKKPYRPYKNKLIGKINNNDLSNNNENKSPHRVTSSQNRTKSSYISGLDFEGFENHDYSKRNINTQKKIKSFHDEKIIPNTNSYDKLTKNKIEESKDFLKDFNAEINNILNRKKGPQNLAKESLKSNFNINKSSSYKNFKNMNTNIGSINMINDDIDQNRFSRPKEIQRMAQTLQYSGILN